MTQTLLVVDDEPQFLRTLQPTSAGPGTPSRPLTTVEGALSAAKGQSLRRRRARPRPADGSGTDVCTGLRAWSDVPIVVVSAVGEEQEKVDALDAGADDYVVKPFPLAELLARLRAVLRRGRRRGAVFASDRSRSTVRVARSTRRTLVHLTPHEFDLLRVLGENEGKLMTHARILREVWGPSYQRSRTTSTSTSRSCDARSRSIPPGRSYCSRPGIGYRLVARNPKTALRPAPTVAAWKSSLRSGDCAHVASCCRAPDS